MNNKSLKPLALTFALSGVWDLIAAILYLFFIGANRMIDNPSANPFYTIFLGSFFLCFAFIQFMSAVNIKRYAFNIGCLIIGRSFYIILLYAFIAFSPGFPSTFWFTGIIDSTFTLLYIIFAFRGGLTIRNLFLPEIEKLA
ncbi:MAG: hypothetical protein H6541_09465 [Lentimicrobiaceae bacterium]|nr:hypothetical protein [Lentimicrobiaceae bacterium]MCB9023950.1 hypothetical protein [Lentimicrobiaceae bacterium]MCO5265560.1 hypothetical protein [Lentimicrobium sp.]HPG32329.1 hypothetical protein [Lentimicrobium sp.]